MVRGMLHRIILGQLVEKMSRTVLAAVDETALAQKVATDVDLYRPFVIH